MRTDIYNTKIEQRSLQWYRARLGNFTGSSIHKLISKKNELTKTALSYVFEVAAERCLASKIVNGDEEFAEYLETVSVTTKAMQFGIDMEDLARATYEMMTGDKVIETGSVAHRDIMHYAASPDGIVPVEDRIIEIKVPKPATFCEYRTLIHDAASLKSVKPEYYWQMMSEMDCTEASSGHFVTFNPYMKEPIHIATIERCQEDIDIIHERIALAEEYINNNII
jgi:exodeoxyribonuclease (lambda-induced)